MYIVSLKQFDGPLDLLLTLITHAKVDIHDIFVSEITEQYLESMKLVDELDMDSASEFLQMAATLLEIKSRAMLPKPPKPEDENGLSPEEAKMVFSRFWRADAGRDRESGGLGIGLAVVKEIVDRHGGWVQVEGRKDQGACFTIHIPLYDEAKARSKDRSQKQQKQQKQSSGRSGKIMSRDRKK